jgi:hypothetical protein
VCKRQPGERGPGHGESCKSDERRAGAKGHTGHSTGRTQRRRACRRESDERGKCQPPKISTRSHERRDGSRRQDRRDDCDNDRGLDPALERRTVTKDTAQGGSKDTFEL